MNKKGILPKQTTCVCDDQLYSFAVAELSDVLLLIQSGVGQHYYLGCKKIKNLKHQLFFPFLVLKEWGTSIYHNHTWNFAR